MDELERLVIDLVNDLAHADKTVWLMLDPLNPVLDIQVLNVLEAHDSHDGFLIIECRTTTHHFWANEVGLFALRSIKTAGEDEDEFVLDVSAVFSGELDVTSSCCTSLRS